MAEKLTATVELMLELSRDTKWRIGDQFFRLRREWSQAGGGDCPFDPTPRGSEICWCERHAFVGRPDRVRALLFPQGGGDEDRRAVR